MQYENIAIWFSGWSKTETAEMPVRERAYWNMRSIEMARQTRRARNA